MTTKTPHCERTCGTPLARGRSTQEEAAPAATNTTDLVPPRPALARLSSTKRLALAVVTDHALYAILDELAGTYAMHVLALASALWGRLGADPVLDASSPAYRVDASVVAVYGFAERDPWSTRPSGSFAAASQAQGQGPGPSPARVDSTHLLTSFDAWRASNAQPRDAIDAAVLVSGLAFQGLSLIHI